VVPAGRQHDEQEIFVTHHGRIRLSVPLLALAAALLALSARVAGQAPTTPVSGEFGTSARCSDFSANLLFISLDVGASPGWVWVNQGNPGFPQFRSVSGLVTTSKVTHSDYPDAHDSHDQNIDVRVDVGQEDILSDVGRDEDGDGNPDTLELEWESGIRTFETSGDGSLGFFPKWAWPVEGDRVWANGDWVFDCGHPKEVDGIKHQRTEIHPIRAVASMRQQIRTVPGSGTTPVPVTATDLYIHGRSGVVTDILDCGLEVLLGTGTCTTPFGAHDPVADHHPRPIDEDFQFDICLPPLPFDKAALAAFFEEGPGNTITDPARAPQLHAVPATGACAADPTKFGPTQIHVTIPLAGSGVSPDDVYARKIYAGWVFPPEGLHHLKLTLNRMHLHDDDDTDPGDCECSFFWMNVGQAPDEWIRLSDYANGDMNDFDDDGGLGSGNMDFTGAGFDFFVANGKPFTVRANGYDGGYGDINVSDVLTLGLVPADCLDDHFGEHDFQSHVDLHLFPFPEFPSACYISLPIDDTVADNDPYASINQSFGPAENYALGAQTVDGGRYNLQFTVEEIPLTAENSADLALTKICKPDDQVLAGDEITCTILVENSGPGLPRNVVVDDTLLTDVAPGAYSVTPPTFTFVGIGGLTDPCDAVIEDIPGGKHFRCHIGTVPIGGTAIITLKITSRESGDFNNRATVTSDSSDPNVTNNAGLDSVHVVAVSDLSISKSDSPDPVAAGTTLTYTLMATNHGPSTAVNVLVEDFLPAGVSITSVTGTLPAACVFGIPGDNSRPTTCAFDSLAPSATGTMTVVVSLNIPGVLKVARNDARVSSAVFDPNNANNLASVDTTIRVAALQIVKTSDADIYKSSATIKYTITVENTGPADALGVVVTDTLPDTKQAIYRTDTGGCTRSNLTLTCALGTIPADPDPARRTRSFNVYVTVKGNKGQVVNTASVASPTFDPDLSNNTSTRTVLIQGGIKVLTTVLAAGGTPIGIVSAVEDGGILILPSEGRPVYAFWTDISSVTDQAVILKIPASEAKSIWAVEF
jgi:uncharacterized repeat protein (TIGR01451 family)